MFRRTFREIFRSTLLLGDGVAKWKALPCSPWASTSSSTTSQSHQLVGLEEQCSPFMSSCQPYDPGEIIIGQSTSNWMGTAKRAAVNREAAGRTMAGGRAYQCGWGVSTTGFPGGRPNAGVVYLVNSIFTRERVTDFPRARSGTCCRRRRRNTCSGSPVV